MLRTIFTDEGISTKGSRLHLKNDGVAQSVRTPNSNRKIARSMPTLSISMLCLW